MLFGAIEVIANVFYCPFWGTRLLNVRFITVPSLGCSRREACI